MLLTDIERYITMGRNASICVYRDRVSGLDIIIVSIYIIHKGDKGYGLQVVFDPVGMIDCGEGWIWETSSMALPTVITLIENYAKVPFELLENVSRTSKLEDVELDLDREEVRRQNKKFINEYKGGETFLPLLPQNVNWETRPYT